MGQKDKVARGQVGSLNNTIANLMKIYKSDFLNVSGTSPWSGNGTLSGTSSAVAGESKHPGIISYSSSANQYSGYRYRIDTSSVYLEGGEETVIVFKTANTLTNVTRRLGFHNATSFSEPSEGAYCEISDGVIDGKTSKNNTKSTTSTNYTLSSNTWYRLVIEINSTATLVTYYLYADDSTTILWTDTLATNIPIVATGHTDICTYSGTSETVLGYLDYMEIIIPNTRRVD